MTKFLDTAANSASQQENIAIDQDDHMLMIEFLESNNGDLSVTKFLDGRPDQYENEASESEDEEDGMDSEELEYGDQNTIMPNSQEIEKNAKKRGKKKKKNGKKSSKKPFGGPDEDVVFVEFLETTLPEQDAFWLQ